MTPSLKGGRVLIFNFHFFRLHFCRNSQCSWGQPWIPDLPALRLEYSGYRSAILDVSTSGEWTLWLLELWWSRLSWESMTEEGSHLKGARSRGRKRDSQVSCVCVCTCIVRPSRVCVGQRTAYRSQCSLLSFGSCQIGWQQARFLAHQCSWPHSAIFL